MFHNILIALNILDHTQFIESKSHVYLSIDIIGVDFQALLEHLDAFPRVPHVVEVNGSQSSRQVEYGNHNRNHTDRWRFKVEV